MNNSRVKKPTLLTHKKLVGNIYYLIIDKVINYIAYITKIDNETKTELVNYIYKNNNLEKILKNKTYNKIRNKLVNTKTS